MGVTIELKGLDEIERKLLALARNVPLAVERALYEEAQIEMTESKQRCPVAPDGGTLRASGTVHPPVREGNDISVTLSYGGAASAYALAVHEHLSEHSPPSWVKAEANGDGVQWNVAGTGPKFLESVINESRPYMAQRIAARIDLEKLL